MNTEEILGGEPTERSSPAADIQRLRERAVALQTRAAGYTGELRTILTSQAKQLRADAAQLEAQLKAQSKPNRRS